MVRQNGKLKDKRVAKLIRDGVRGSYYDGQGLCLKVKSRKVSAWESRYQIDGVTRYMGLGSAKVFSLVEARERNRTLVRQKLADGIDPLATRRAERAAQVAAAAKAKTFAEACDEFLEQQKQQGVWSNAKHAGQWRATLETYALPILGELPVADIDVPLILKVLEQPVAANLGYDAGSLWVTRQETASRLRGRLEAVLDWCKARQLRTGDNPASASVIDKVLPVRKTTEHHEALDYKTIPNFMTELRAREGSAARALEYLILNAARSREVIEARWSEINFDEAVWNVPAEHMKMKKAHRVPLSDAAIALLRGLYREGDGNDGFIFIGAQAGKPMGHTTMLMLLKRMGPDATVHGMRAAFRTWAGECTSYAPDICEAALAHVRGKVEAAYARGTLFDKRRKLMAAWSKYCNTPIRADRRGKVVAIGTGR